jgi:hypothetical protein
VFQNWKGVLNLFDDTTVYGKDEEAHNTNLRAALQVLLDTRLTLYPDKCKFCVKELLFFGHHISSTSTGPSEENQSVIKKFRALLTKHEGRSFLGLLDFCLKFMPDFATIRKPLCQLAKKTVDFRFGLDEQNSHDTLKDSLSLSPTLRCFKCDAKVTVVTDSSPVGLGAALIQVQDMEPQAI